MPEFGCIFDCDGTLLDSMGAWRAAEHELARRSGQDLTRDQLDRLTTMSVPEAAELFHVELGLGKDVAEMVDEIYRLVGGFYATETVVRPGVKEFLEGLSQRGVPMAVASSTPYELLKIALGTTGLLDYFQAVLSVDDAGYSKRSPEVYDLAASRLGTTRENTWGFEDALYAVNTLANAGFHTVGVYDCDLSGTPEQLREAAEVYVASFEELDGATFPAGL